MYQVAKAAYGPRAGTVMYENNWPIGGSKVSRDGVTNLRKVTVKDRAVNMVAKAVLQASERNNAVVGDGTTAATILTYHLYITARKLVGSGYNPMDVSRMIDETSKKAIEYIDEIKTPFDEKDLLAVASVSSGDDEIAKLIYNTVIEVGSTGGITVEEHGGLGVYAETIEGFYLRKGFSDVRLVKDGGNLSSDFENVPIFLCDKILSDPREMATIIARIKQAGHKELLILGEVIHDANELLVKERNGKSLIATVANIPATAGMKSIVLDDLAVMTGGRVYSQGESAGDFDVSYLGAAGRAIVEETSTTVIDGAGEPEEIKQRLDDLEKQLTTETHPVTTQAIKMRISMLKGKIGIVKVGAPTDLEREELRLRIDDAVCALQSARKDGTVPGGGTTMARIKGTPFDEVLQKPFIELMSNAGEKAEYKLGKVLDAPLGYGYDLKNMTDEPIDLRKAGILDPTLVIKEVIRNACSIAGVLIVNEILLPFADSPMELAERLKQ